MREVYTLDVEARRAEDWEHWILLVSDQHHDSLFSDHELEERHLKYAKRLQADVFSFGDTFCAMQGKWDPRADEREMRPELTRGKGSYLDRIVNYNAEFYADFADQIRMFGIGNHEVSVFRRHETDLTERLVERIEALKGTRPDVGAYRGWIRVMLREDNVCRQQLRIYYDHGSGGAAPVTKGVIKTNRDMAMLADADVVVAGHTHTQYHVALSKLSLTDSGNPKVKTIHNLRIPGYKMGWASSAEGMTWENQKGFAPNPIGGWWLRIRWYKRYQRFIVTPIATE
jgi:hypothetical protein